MNKLILALILINGVNQAQESIRPQATDEQFALIEKLGDRDYRVREKADYTLRKMGYKALVALEKKGLKSEDLEISTRAKAIHASYFRITGTNNKLSEVTGLFKLNKVPLKNGKILHIPPGTAQKYLAKAIQRVCGGDENEAFFNAVFYCYSNEECQITLQQASMLFIQDLYRNGYSQSEVIEIIDAIQKNQDNWKPNDLRQDETRIEYSGQYMDYPC